MRRSRWLLILIALLALHALGGTAASARTTSPLLFVTTTGDLRITGTHGHMRISMPARAPLTWFTDRPTRRAGAATAASLAAGWTANGFDRVPPNAALVTQRAGSSMQTIVTLTQPLRRRGRVSFAYRVLDDGSMLGMRTSGRPQLGRYRGELFVDDATVPPCTSVGFGFEEVDAGASQTCAAARGSTISVDLTRPGTATVRVCGANGSGTIGIPSTDWRDPPGAVTHSAVTACPLSTDVPPRAVLTVQQPCPWPFCKVDPDSIGLVADIDLVIETVYAPPVAGDPASVPPLR